MVSIFTFLIPLHLVRPKIWFTKSKGCFDNSFWIFFYNIGENEVTAFGKLLPDQFPNWGQMVYEEIYGADFSTLTRTMEEGS